MNENDNVNENLNENENDNDNDEDDVIHVNCTTSNMNNKSLYLIKVTNNDNDLLEMFINEHLNPENEPNENKQIFIQKFTSWFNTLISTEEDIIKICDEIENINGHFLKEDQTQIEVELFPLFQTICKYSYFIYIHTLILHTYIHI